MHTHVTQQDSGPVFIQGTSRNGGASSYRAAAQNLRRYYQRRARSESQKHLPLDYRKEGRTGILSRSHGTNAYDQTAAATVHEGLARLGGQGQEQGSGIPQR